MIEFQYFDGCPNSVQTLYNIRILIREGLILKSDLVISKIESVDEAAKYNFQGSPTILFNGVDIYTESKPTDYNYTCRIYDIEGKRTGVIPVTFIREKLNKIV